MAYFVGAIHELPLLCLIPEGVNFQGRTTHLMPSNLLVENNWQSRLWIME